MEFVLITLAMAFVLAVWPPQRGGAWREFTRPLRRRVRRGRYRDWPQR